MRKQETSIFRQNCGEKQNDWNWMDGRVWVSSVKVLGSTILFVVLFIGYCDCNSNDLLYY